MNVFNRIVVVLLLVAVAFTAIVAAVIPDQIVLAMQQIFDPMKINLLDRIVLAVAAIVITILSLLLIRAELRREKSRGVVLGSVEGASAHLETNSIAESLKQALEALPDVHGAVPTVKSHGNAVEIQVVLQADPSVDVTQKASEAAGVIRETVERGMGVKIAKGSPKVDIKYRRGSAPRVDMRG